MVKKEKCNSSPVSNCLCTVSPTPSLSIHTLGYIIFPHFIALTNFQDIVRSLYIFSQYNKIGGIISNGS